MDKTKIIIVGADPSLYASLARMLSHRGIEVLSERDIRMPIPDVMFGSKPTTIVIDDLVETHAMLPGMRGSAKSKAFADYMWHQRYPAQLPADQVKGPKGPRTKWGKIR